MKKQHKPQAFSLVEMLMALLVASLLLMAFAPVMTKRLQENVNVTGMITNNNGNETHGVQIFEYDSINDADKDFSKYNFTAPTGVHTVSLVLQAGGGGGGGASSGYLAYNNVLQTSASTDSQTIRIEGDLIGIKNLRVDLTGGGGGGGGGIAAVIDCKDPSLHKYINPTQGNGTQQCVNKFNVGDSGGPAVASGMIKCVTAEMKTNATAKAECQKCTDSTNANYAKCYYKVVYTDCGEDPKGGWTGCNRTVMEWNAAKASCDDYTGASLAKGKWRLPKVADVTKWKTYKNEINDGQGANGLQLCSYYETHVAERNVAYCGLNWRDGACYGSWGDDCDSAIHLGDESSATTVKCLIDTSLAISGKPTGDGVGYKENANHARCLTTDNGAFTFAYKTGGGGGSGARVYNYTLPKTYNNKELLAEGNTVTITRGNYGGGGSGAGVDGSSGSPSCITVKDSGGASIFYLCANGGNAGKGASATSYGNGGSSISTCRLGTSSSSYSTVNCSSIGNGAVAVSKEGSNGTSNNNAVYNTTVSGGNGGVSTYNTSLAGGSGGSGVATKTVAQTTINGKAPAVSGSNIPYGAGGGGGSSGRGADSSTVIVGNGGNGYVGHAKITYDVERTGGSGGGGGGGSMVAVSSLEVEAGKTYEVIAGKGGRGGNVNGDGANGYLSSFKHSATKSIVANAGSGGKGGDHSGTYGKGGEKGSGGNTTRPTVGYGIKMNKGEDGTKGYDYDFNPATNEGTKKSVGGNGGKSGIRTDGACGALTYYRPEDTEDPSASAVSSANRCMTTNVSADSALYLLNTLVMGTDYGKAGSGGGGGGFESFSLHGTGGNGGNGYVYVKW